MPTQQSIPQTNQDKRSSPQDDRLQEAQTNPECGDFPLVQKAFKQLTIFHQHYRKLPGGISKKTIVNHADCKAKMGVEAENTCIC